MEKKPDLKPCPFCGGEEIHTRIASVAGAWVTFVECSRCPAGVTGDLERFAVESWNTRAYDPTVSRVVAHMKQVEWENQQLLKQMEEVKRIYRTDLASVRRDDRIAIAEYYEEELRVARQRASMMEEVFTAVKQTMEEEIGDGH
jgi:Lar family restriction alleviation protein